MEFCLFVYFVFHISEFSVWGMCELCQLTCQTAGSPKLMGVTKTCTQCLWSPQTGVSWDTLCQESQNRGWRQMYSTKMASQLFGCDLSAACIIQNDGWYQQSFPKGDSSKVTTMCLGFFLLLFVFFFFSFPSFQDCHKQNSMWWFKTRTCLKKNTAADFSVENSWRKTVVQGLV